MKPLIGADTPSQGMHKGLFLYAVKVVPGGQCWPARLSWLQSFKLIASPAVLRYLSRVTDSSAASRSSLAKAVANSCIHHRGH